MRCQIRITGILVKTEIVEHPSPTHNFRLSNGLVGVWIDLHSHEELLGRSGVVEIAELRGILNAVDTRLLRLHLTWEVAHAFVPQPDTGFGLPGVEIEVDSPD